MNVAQPCRRNVLLIFTVVVTAATISLGQPRRLAAADEAAGKGAIDPKAAALLDKYVEVTGGKAAYDKIKNRVSKMTMELATPNVKMEMTAYAAKPNKTYTLITSAQLGSMEQGCDGKTVWSRNAMEGAKIITGAQRAMMLRDGTMDRFAYWRQLYNGVKYGGTEDVEGKPCHKIVLTPKPLDPSDAQSKERPQTIYINQKTHLIEKIETQIELPQGVVPVSVLISDYRDVDGIKLSYKMTMNAMGQVRTVNIVEVKNNVELKPGRFELPPEIKELLNK